MLLLEWSKCSLVPEQSEDDDNELQSYSLVPNLMTMKRRILIRLNLSHILAEMSALTLQGEQLASKLW